MDCSQCCNLMEKRNFGTTLVQVISTQMNTTIKILNHSTNIPDPLKSIQFKHHSEGRYINTLLEFSNFSSEIQVLSAFYRSQQGKRLNLDSKRKQLIGQFVSQLKRQSLQVNEEELIRRLQSIDDRKIQQRNHIISSFHSALLLVTFLSVFIINLAMFMQLVIIGKSYWSILQIKKTEISWAFIIYFVSIFAPPLIKAIYDYCNRNRQRPQEMVIQIFCELFMLGPIFYSLQLYFKKRQISKRLPNYYKKIQNSEQMKIYILIYFSHSFKSIIYLSFYKTLEIFFLLREIYAPLTSLTQLFSLLDIGLCFSLYFIEQLARRFTRQQMKKHMQDRSNDLTQQPGTLNQISLGIN